MRWRDARIQSRQLWLKFRDLCSERQDFGVLAVFPTTESINPGGLKIEFIQDFQNGPQLGYTPRTKLGILGNHAGLEFDIIIVDPSLIDLHKIVNSNVSIGSNEMTKRLVAVVGEFRHMAME